MHERNPYARPPDFAALCASHAELRRYCTLVANGKVVVDFSDDAAVRALTRALLKHDFGLDVELPQGSLCPRVPQRLNYLLWIEDILNASSLSSDDVIGIDIGTGASCIYALLGARRFDWRFTASEADVVSCEVARENVERNGLQDRVTVVKADANGSIIEDLVTSSSTAFTFCMCNPPFFDGDGETGERFEEEEREGEGRQWSNRRTTTKRGRPPHSGTVASDGELAVEGGECAFVGRLVEESSRLKERVKLYTSMLGKKSSVSVLKTRLAKMAERERGLRFTSGELVQGRTQRWLLAWTYCEDVKLPSRAASLDLCVKGKSAAEARHWLRDQLLSLSIDVVVVGGEDEEGSKWSLACTASSPSWLRRKKKKRRKGEEKEEETEREEEPPPPFEPLPFTVTSRDENTVTLNTVTFEFRIGNDARKRELSQLVVHIANKLITSNPQRS